MTLPSASFRVIVVEGTPETFSIVTLSRVSEWRIAPSVKLNFVVVVSARFRSRGRPKGSKLEYSVPGAVESEQSVSGLEQLAHSDSKVFRPAR